jgi:signal transduction histidine kinase
MRERAEMVGGNLNLTSQPGYGTTVEIRVPLEG